MRYSPVIENLPQPLVALLVAPLYGMAVGLGLLIARLSLDIGTVWLAASVGLVSVLIWGY